MSDMFFYRKNFQWIGILVLIGLDYFYVITANFFTWSALADAFLELFFYILIILLILNQKSQLSKNNIDSFSILLLVICDTLKTNRNYPDSIQTSFFWVKLLITVAFIIYFRKNGAGEFKKLSARQLLLFLFGLALGLAIALLKLMQNNSELIQLAYNQPLNYFLGLVSAFFLSLVDEEFVYRGLLWGYLRNLGLRDHWSIVISTLLWVFSHRAIYNNVPELINFVMLGLFFGFLVSKTKTIVASMGAHAGYNSFLIFQDIFLVR